MTKQTMRIVHLRNFFLSMILALCWLTVGCSDRPRAQSPRIDTTAGPTLRLVDAIGDTVMLSRPARRVISLAPNLTEMIFAIGAGEVLIGRTDFCDHPPAALSVPSIGDYQSLNYERLLSMEPDLILMTYAGNTRSAYEKLQEIGLRPYVLEAATVEGVIHTIDTVGLLLGRPDKAATVSQGIASTVDSIRTLASAAPRMSVFVVINASPLMTTGRGFIDEALTITGGRNIAAGSSAAYPTYSREDLQHQDPDVIIVAGSSHQDAVDLLRLYPEWKALSAVRNNRLYVLPADIILRPGPRIEESIRLLYQALHGADPHRLLDEAQRQNK